MVSNPLYDYKYLQGFSTTHGIRMHIKAVPLKRTSLYTTAIQQGLVLLIHYHCSTLFSIYSWENGQIGFPAVDAVMNQLRTEGWMHHLARHLTACFLTRGDLWITWEAGRDIFEKYLLDADWHINNFSWHWLSCSAFFHQV